MAQAKYPVGPVYYARDLSIWPLEIFSFSLLLFNAIAAEKKNGYLSSQKKTLESRISATGHRA